MKSTAFTFSETAHGNKEQLFVSGQSFSISARILRERGRERKRERVKERERERCCERRPSFCVYLIAIFRTKLHEYSPFGGLCTEQISIKMFSNTTFQQVRKG